VAARRAQARAKAKTKPAGDDAALAKYEHHRTMAEKHRAHADLIEAKLRTQGKEIRTVYPGDGPKMNSPSAKPQKKIVPASDRHY
jgi:hypothetical protein